MPADKTPNSKSSLPANTPPTPSTPSTPSTPPTPDLPTRTSADPAIAHALQLNQQATPDRRTLDRNSSGYTGPERRKDSRRTGEDGLTGTQRRKLAMGSDTGLEVVRGPGIRRDIERKAAEEGEMTAHQFEFVMAVETFKKVNKKMYPTWTEILGVLFQLGYKKMEARTIQLENVPEAPLFDPAAEQLADQQAIEEYQANQKRQQDEEKEAA